jgi:hypothetical protein
MIPSTFLRLAATFYEEAIDIEPIGTDFVLDQLRADLLEMGEPFSFAPISIAPGCRPAGTTRGRAASLAASALPARDAGSTMSVLPAHQAFDVGHMRSVLARSTAPESVNGVTVIR